MGTWRTWLTSLVVAGCDAPPAVAPPPDAASADAAAPDAAFPAYGPPCAEVFRVDGVCRPRLEACPPGHVVHLTPDGPDSGCVPVGPPRCRDAGDGEDGCPPCEVCETAGAPCHPSFVVDGVCTPGGCAEGELALPAEGCVPLQPEGCGPEPWGHLPDVPGAVHVDPAASPDGADGSRARPFPNLAAALVAAPDGATVLLAAGTYGSLVVERPLTVIGRCPERVEVRATESVNGVRLAAFVRNTAGATLRGLTLVGGQLGLAVVNAEADVTAVAVRGAGVGAFVAEDAKARLRRFRVSGAGGDLASSPALEVAVRAEATLEGADLTGNFARGLRVVGAGSRATVRRSTLGRTRGRGDQGWAVEVNAAALRLEKSVVVAARAAGVIAAGGAELDVVRSTVARTRSAGPEAPGRGVEVGGSRARLEAVAVVGNRGAGVLVSEPGAELTLRDAFVAGTRPSSAGVGGDGVVIQQGARGRVTGSALRDNRGVGVLVVGSRADNRIEGNRIEGNRKRPSGGFSGGVVVSDGRATVRRNVIVDNQWSGVAVRKGSVTEIEENLIARTVPDSDGVQFWSWGVWADGGARARLARNRIEHNDGSGVASGETGTMVESRDDRVIGRVEGGRVDEATGLVVTWGGRMTVDGGAVIRSRSAGVFVWGEGSALQARGLLVADVKPRRSDGVSGAGLDVSGGAEASFTDGVITGTHLAGVFIFDASLELARSRVAGVRPSAIEDIVGNRYEGLADGLFAGRRSRVELTATWIEDCDRAAVLADDAAGRLASGVLTGSGYGLVVSGTTRPEVGAELVARGNRIRDTDVEGALPVPDEPSPVPEHLRARFDE